MKLQIDQIPNLEETEIYIKCKEIDSKINKISNYIRTSYITINGKIDNEQYVINLDDIFYFEAVENKVFAYVEKDVYEVNYKILELEELLRNTSFLRVSRVIVLNILKIDPSSYTLRIGLFNLFAIGSARRFSGSKSGNDTIAIISPVLEFISIPIAALVWYFCIANASWS